MFIVYNKQLSTIFVSPLVPMTWSDLDPVIETWAKRHLLHL